MLIPAVAISLPWLPLATRSGPCTAILPRHRRRHHRPTRAGQAAGRGGRGSCHHACCSSAGPPARRCDRPRRRSLLLRLHPCRRPHPFPQRRACRRSRRHPPLPRSQCRLPRPWLPPRLRPRPPPPRLLNRLPRQRPRPTARPPPRRTQPSAWQAFIGNAARVPITFNFKPSAVTLNRTGERDIDRLVAYLKQHHATGNRVYLAAFTDNSGDPAGQRGGGAEARGRGRRRADKFGRDAGARGELWVGDACGR